jgi:hypothetical protein
VPANTYEVTRTTTVLEALVCGRFTDRQDLLYHQAAGIPPFRVLSPALPPGYVSAKEGEEPTRFDVNWLARRQRAKAAQSNKQLQADDDYRSEAAPPPSCVCSSSKTLCGPEVT